MKYQSKKDQNIYAELIEEQEKFKTVILEYLTGENKGKTFNVTTSTLKRWWKKVNEVPTVEDEVVTEKTSNEILNVDMDRINTPYPEPTHQEYIPKPKSVIEYEENKKRGRFNAELPSQDEMVEQFASKLSKINKTYIVFQSGSWLERKSGYTNLYATEEVWERLTNEGFEARKNGMKNTKLPVVFKIVTIEEYNTIANILTEEF